MNNDPAPETNPEQLKHLQSENARLTALLEAHGIEWRLPVPTPPSPLQLSPQDKISLFRRKVSWSKYSTLHHLYNQT